MKSNASASREGVKPPSLEAARVAEFGEAEALRQRLEVDVVAGLGSTEEGQGLVRCQFSVREDQPLTGLEGGHQPVVSGQIDVGGIAVRLDQQARVGACGPQPGNPQPRLRESCLKRVEHGGDRLGMSSEEVEIVGPAAHHTSNDQRAAAGEGHSSALGQAGDDAAHAALQVGQHRAAS